MTDADLDVSHPTPADVESARALSHAYDQAARGVGGIAERFARDAGAVVEGSRDEFTSVRATFDQAAMDLAVIASVLADLRQAGDRWLRDAPKSADFAAAQAAIDAARIAYL